jgi:acetyl esterase/lipase
MSAVHITLIIVAALVSGAALLFVVGLVRFIVRTRRPIPIAVSRAARLVAGDVPLSAAGPPTPAMDVYAPVDIEGRPPLILFVPGDGPDALIRRAKQWGIFRSYADIAAGRGYFAAVMNHRSSRNFKDSAGMVGDVEHALATLRDRSDEFGFDPERVVVWTFSGSAGPVLSRLLLERPQGVIAMLSHYGLLDLTTFTFKVPDEVVNAYSLPQVLKRLDAMPLPVYLLNAGRDRAMITTGFERVEALVRERELAVTTRIYPRGRHGFEVLESPEQVRAQLEQSFAFIDGTLPEVAEVQSRKAASFSHRLKRPAGSPGSRAAIPLNQDRQMTWLTNMHRRKHNSNRTI